MLFQRLLGRSSYGAAAIQSQHQCALSAEHGYGGICGKSLRVSGIYERFQVEIQTMPEEVRLISETAGLFTPQEVAAKHVKDIKRGTVSTVIGLDGWMLGTLTAGAGAENSLPNAVIQVRFKHYMIFGAGSCIYGTADPSQTYLADPSHGPLPRCDPPLPGLLQRDRQEVLPTPSRRGEGRRAVDDF